MTAEVGVSDSGKGAGEMNFCAGTAPAWANEIRHPDMDSTEFWCVLSIVTAVDSQREITVGLVQNGPGALPQVAVGGVRFSVFEAEDCSIALRRALELVGGWEGQAASGGAPSEAAPGGASDGAVVQLSTG